VLGLGRGNEPVACEGIAAATLPSWPGVVIETLQATYDWRIDTDSEPGSLLILAKSRDETMLQAQLADVHAKIEALEAEREAIYRDSHVDENEHPRLVAIISELEALWDLRRRIEAAVSAGLDELPVPPPAHPDDLIG
jgi:hypothetical protein